MGGVVGARAARSLFVGGATASPLAFQFASTNLVIELGIVTWVLIGCQFTLAELVGGLALIATVTLLLRLLVSKRMEQQAREHARSLVSVTSTTRPASACRYAGA